MIASNLCPAERSDDDSMASSTANLPGICMMRDPHASTCVTAHYRGQETRRCRVHGQADKLDIPDIGGGDVPLFLGNVSKSPASKHFVRVTWSASEKVVGRNVNG
jgi:hypothetical protein